MNKNRTIEPIDANPDDLAKALLTSNKMIMTKPELRAIRKGNFEEEFGFDADCYVLDDERHTAVVSKSGMARALGMSKGGNRITRLVNSKSLASLMGPDLRKKIDNPLIFKDISEGAGSNTEVHGYDVTILIDICQAIKKANEEGKLAPNQKHIARQAGIIVDASAKVGITGLVYSLAGYDFDKQAYIDAFKLYVRESARDYEKEFDEELYNEWYRIYELPKPGRNKPWKFKHLTVEQVYKPLAGSDGKLLDLLRDSKKQHGKKSTKLHQFLQEVGVKALRKHLGRLIGIANLSNSRLEYERNFEKVFKRQLTLDLKEDEDCNE